MKYDFILIGLTSGGPKALYSIIDKFNESFNIPIIIIQNLPPGFDTIFCQVFQEKAKIPIVIVDKEVKLENKIYLPKSGNLLEIIEKNIIKTQESVDTRQCISYFIKNCVEKRMKPILVFLSGICLKGDPIDGCKLAKENNIPIIVQNIEENPNLILKYETELPSTIIKEECYTFISNLMDIPEKIKELLAQ